VEEFAIGSNYPGALLATVLKRIEAVVRQFRGVRMPINAEDTAVMLWVALHQSQAHYPMREGADPAKREVSSGGALHLTKPSFNRSPRWAP
jgi:hypothetical protein